MSNGYELKMYEPIEQPRSRKESFSHDEADMNRMGKKQEFRRNFDYLSIASFSVVAIAGWCYAPSTFTTGLYNGGSGGLIIMFLVNWLGLFFVALSLAEMSSIAPTAGGQYHWVSEFAPPSLQKLSSYFSGWLSSISWIAGFASAASIIGLTFQGLIVVMHPNYVPQPYQAYLFVVMTTTFALLVNTLLARYLPHLEGLVFIMFCLAFLAVMVVLWVLAPRLTAGEVFTTIQANSGWSSLGISLLTGQSAVMFLLVGWDSTAHMAEETKNAATTVPRAMITSYIVNGGLCFVMLVTYCFLLVDYDTVEDSPTGVLGLPFIQVFINSTNSAGGGTAIIAILCIIQTFGLCNWMASTARQIFAFARDGGFPYGRWMAKVDSAGTYPINSVIVVWAGVVLLNLISLGSQVAFLALTSLQILALMFTYLISLSCIIWRKCVGDPLPRGPWTLGRVGLPVNVVGWMYCAYLVVFLPFPAVMPITAGNFNWASVMFAGIILIATIYYLLWARKTYKGPVVAVRARL